MTPDDIIQWVVDRKIDRPNDTANDISTALFREKSRYQPPERVAEIINTARASGHFALRQSVKHSEARKKR